VWIKYNDIISFRNQKNGEKYIMALTCNSRSRLLFPEIPTEKLFPDEERQSLYAQTISNLNNMRKNLEKIS